MNGFIDFLKPPGMSSASAVAFVKSIFHVRVGHAGTLDPEAAGVLPIMVGRATRLLDYFSFMGKEYIAHVSFTGATDTQDATGRLCTPGKGVPESEAFLRLAEGFKGEIVQRPSAFSAVKRDGVPLYSLARKGSAEPAPERTVRIDSLEMIRRFGDGYLIRVACGGGTYIRTLCHDLGAAAGCPAHMRFLLRTRSASFSIRDAVPPEELLRQGSGALLPLDYPLGHYRRIDIASRHEKAARNGLAWEMPDRGLRDAEIVRVYLSDRFVGLAQSDGSKLKMRVYCFDD